jgi:phage terminase large subunit-like protein
VRIFISIASYRDPELQWTIKSAIENANNPDNLYFGVVYQGVDSELFDIDSLVVDSALRPSQIARKSPLLSMWSTAGDQNSETMIKLRQQAMADIDKNIPSLFYFAEWSMPSHLSPLDEKNFCWANPSLGTTITIDALRAVSKKDSFMRAHLNQWITARGAWLDLGVWEKNQTDIAMPEGGILAVDADGALTIGGCDADITPLQRD